MKAELVVQLHSQFESHVQADGGVEFWRARDLQDLLGYTEWRNFLKAIEKAKTACTNSGQQVQDHFVDSNKMVEIGSGGERVIADIALTRYACYLIAQNGDPSKPQVAFAQTYFAVQTRKQEVIAQRLADLERVEAREKLTATEKRLSGIIFERLHDDQTFARIRSKGDQALFGGRTTQEMKRKLGAPGSRAFADFLPTITIKAKDFATELTNFNVQRDDLKTENQIASEHIKNNRVVRGALQQRGIRPESLPPAEDLQKVERRIKSETKKLPGVGDKLKAGPDRPDSAGLTGP